MTKNEFAQRVAIALAGNSRFLNPDCTVDFQGIIDAADELTERFEMGSNYGRFDDSE